MIKKPLTSLYERYKRRSSSLNARFMVKLPENPDERVACEPMHQDGRAYLVARLQHLWGEFCRELVVKSALGGCETRTGKILPHASGVKRVSDVPQIAKTPLAGVRSNWDDPEFTIDQAMRLKVANFNDIELGLAPVSIVADNIRCVRNYIVHPNSRTSSRYAQTARVLGFSGLPPDQLLSRTVPGGETVFENWLSILILAAWSSVA